MGILETRGIPRRAPGPYPLSFGQQRLWFIDQLTAGGPAYNSQRAIRFDGVFSFDAMARAIDEIVRRHTILRTTFPRAGEWPVQIVGPAERCSIEFTDLSGCAGEAQTAALDRTARTDALRPFDLTNGPTLRLRLVCLGERAHVLLVCMHHIVADGWSFGIFSRELASLYPACGDAACALPQLPIQYGDYASWQRDRFAEARIGPLVAYWRQQTRNLPRLTLRGGRAVRDEPDHRRADGAIDRFDLDLEDVEALRVLARRTRTTVFMIVLAAFEVLLHYWTEEPTIVVTADVGGRHHAETEPLIGLFVNQVVLRTDVSAALEFGALLARIKAVVVGACAHQDLPFDRLVQEIRRHGDGGRLPISPVHVVYQHARLPGAQFDGLSIRTVPTAYTPARFDLTLFVRDKPDGLSTALVYRAALFSPTTIALRLRQLRTILAAIVDRPDVTVRALCLALAELERTQRQMDANDITRTNAQSFRSVKPRPVTLSQEPVRFGALPGGDRLPLLVQPNSARVDLVAWAAERRALLETKLALHGAILFRDFGVDSPLQFERFAQTICADLFDENGEHVRASVSGKVYTPTFYPSDKKVLWHNENSFNMVWPRLIMFCCMTPADEGGETPLVDSRKVFDAIDPEIRETFARRQVKYVRNYGSGLGLTWQEIFQTSDKADVEYYCHTHDMSFQWKPGDRLRTECVRPAIIRHPRTGELVWFTQAQHWHLSCLDPEVRATLTSLLADDDLPRNCYYGDGTPIEDAVMNEICAVYQRLEVSYPWHTGDIVVVDNVLTAHARNPFKGQRKLCVALGEMTSYDQVQMS